MKIIQMIIFAFTIFSVSVGENKPSRFCKYAHLKMTPGEELVLPQMCAAKRCESKNGRMTLKTLKCPPMTDRNKLKYCIILSPKHNLPYPHCCPYFDCTMANFVKEMHENAKLEGVVKKFKI